MMKVLIGTPIHESKHYCIHQWFASVAQLLKISPARILLVDNSPDLSYVAILKKLCNKYGITDYDITHIHVEQENGRDERIGRSREVIRQYVLHYGYDAWFSWESDQLIPAHTLKILSDIMESGNYSMIHPNTWSRENPSEPEANFGACLISRKELVKYGFLLEYPNMPKCWYGGETWFKKQVIKGGGSYIEIYGTIKPILHINQAV